MKDDVRNSDGPADNPELVGIVDSGTGFRQPIDARVSMRRTEVALTSDHALWAAIRNRTEAIGFNNYSDFIDRVISSPGGTAALLNAPTTGKSAKKALAAALNIYGVDAYQVVKLATQAFLLVEAGVAIKVPKDWKTGQDKLNLTDPVPGEEGRIDEQVTFKTLRERLQSYLGPNNQLPYLDRIVTALIDPALPVNPNAQPFSNRLGLLRNRFSFPSLIELIWSYWYEEGMLAQTMNAISLRFQNKRGPSDRDPLANLELDPLRPLNNLLWGFIQDEYNRLTVIRRAYEYDHQYGLTLYGRAVPELRSADSRSKFIEGFHNLLYRAATFYKHDADTTVIADGFPLLNSLKEVHLLLAEGAHNQFGDLPWTARGEMLMTQWMLGRPEMREFLRGRAMVPYQERWMGQVDTMKRLQGWNDTTITHFRNLAVYGEQILLSVRYGDWIDANDQDQAKTWARYWRSEIQSYIHSYLAATGVDLGEEIRDSRRAETRYVQPSTLLRERLATQSSAERLPSGVSNRALLSSQTAGATLPATRRRALKPAGE
jgi:hypothetical protein